MYFLGEVGIVGAIGFFWLLLLINRMISSNRFMKDMTSDLNEFAGQRVVVIEKITPCGGIRIA